MKKIISILLIFSMLLALGLTLASCGDGNTDNGENENGENNVPEDESKYQITKDQWIENLSSTNYTATSTSPDDPGNVACVYADDDVLKESVEGETYYCVMIDGKAYMIYNGMKIGLDGDFSLRGTTLKGVDLDDYESLVYDSEKNAYTLSVTDANTWNGDFTFYFENGVLMKITAIRTIQEKTHTINTVFSEFGTTVVDYEYTPEK